MIRRIHLERNRRVGIRSKRVDRHSSERTTLGWNLSTGDKVVREVPRTRAAFETLLATAVEMTEAQQRSVAQAEGAPMPRAEKSGGLPVMA